MTWVLARYLANIQLLTVVLALQVSEARSTCLVASLPAEHFRELLRSEPGVAQVLLPRLVRSLRRAFTNSARWQLRTVFTPNACGWRH